MVDVSPNHFISQEVFRMLVEIEEFTNWLRRRNPTARTWRDYQYDLVQFATLLNDPPPSAITIRDVDRFVSAQAAPPFQVNEGPNRTAGLYTFVGEKKVVYELTAVVQATLSALRPYALGLSICFTLGTLLVTIDLDKQPASHDNLRQST
jgi:hypothetical protein